jgi:hypothetical protein
MRPARPKYQLWHIMTGIAVLAATFSMNEVVYGIGMLVAIVVILFETIRGRSGV